MHLPQHLHTARICHNTCNISFRSYPCCGCHGLSCPVPPRPLCCTGTSPTLAHEVAMSASCSSILAWCVVCGVHPPASVRIRVGKPSPSCLVVSPLVVAPPSFGYVSVPALLLFFTCPSLCAGVLWPIPDWVWRDIRSSFFFVRLAQGERARCSPPTDARSTGIFLIRRQR